LLIFWKKWPPPFGGPPCYESEGYATKGGPTELNLEGKASGASLLNQKEKVLAGLPGLNLEELALVRPSWTDIGRKDTSVGTPSLITTHMGHKKPPTWVGHYAHDFTVRKSCKKSNLLTFS